MASEEAGALASSTLEKDYGIPRYTARLSLAGHTIRLIQCDSSCLMRRV
jgi:hypothetical protein